MIFPDVIRALWRMLEPRRRVYFSILIVLLFVVGLFEMGGMMIIFGFIRGLHVNPESLKRGGALARSIEWYFDSSLSDIEYATYGGALVVLALLAKNTLSLIVRYHNTRFLANLNQRVGLQLFAALATLPYEQAIRSGLQDLEDRLQSTLGLLNSCFRHATQIVASGAVLTTILALLAYIDPRLTAVFVTLFGVFGLAQNRYLNRKLKALANAEKQASSAAHAHLADTFGGLVEARLRDRVSYFQKLYGKALGVQMRSSRKLAAWSRVPGSANEMLLISAIVLAVLVMALRGASIEANLPVFAAFGFAGMRSVSAIASITKSFQYLTTKASRFRKVVRELERLAPAALGSANTDVPSYYAGEKPLPDGRDGRLRKHVELKKVTFRYPGTKRRALDRVSLKIKRGQFASFCGPSGSGKSTLVMVLVGLLRPNQGEVLCDDWNVFDHVRAWQRTIGYVGQSAYLSASTIRENVAFGLASEEIDDARLWNALDLAAARNFVEQLPEGLDTRLSAEGGGLSGGQRQRLLIARALYHDPDIVVFDEATAALDNVTEREITEAAVRLSRTKTVICVAHRLSTIERSDVIFVMDEGRIVGKGTYEQLLATSECFRRLAMPPTKDGDP